MEYQLTVGSRIVLAKQGKRLHRIEVNMLNGSELYLRFGIGFHAFAQHALYCFRDIDGSTVIHCHLCMQAKVLGFQRYINSLSSKAYASLLSRGMLIDPRLTKAQAGKDIEPEYIALSDHVSLNAVKHNAGIHHK